MLNILKHRAVDFYPLWEEKRPSEARIAWLGSRKLLFTGELIPSRNNNRPRGTPFFIYFFSGGVFVPACVCCECKWPNFIRLLVTRGVKVRVWEMVGLAFTLLIAPSPPPLHEQGSRGVAAR